MFQVLDRQCEALLVEKALGTMPTEIHVVRVFFYGVVEVKNRILILFQLMMTLSQPILYFRNVIFL